MRKYVRVCVRACACVFEYGIRLCAYFSTSQVECQALIHMTFLASKKNAHFYRMLLMFGNFGAYGGIHPIICHFILFRWHTLPLWQRSQRNGTK